MVFLLAQAVLYDSYGSNTISLRRKFTDFSGDLHYDTTVDQENFPILFQLNSQPRFEENI